MMEYYSDERYTITITKIDKTRRSGYVVDVYDEQNGEHLGFFARTKKDAENIAKKIKSGFHF